jgi:hypothetical protein
MAIPFPLLMTLAMEEASCCSAISLITFMEPEILWSGVFAIPLRAERHTNARQTINITDILFLVNIFIPLPPGSFSCSIRSKVQNTTTMHWLQGLYDKVNEG